MSGMDKYDSARLITMFACCVSSICLGVMQKSMLSVCKVDFCGTGQVLL